MNDPSLLQEACTAILYLVSKMNQEERKKLFEQLDDEYCLFCGNNEHRQFLIERACQAD